jgi:hypothetical protein
MRRTASQMGSTHLDRRRETKKKKKKKVLEFFKTLSPKALSYPEFTQFNCLGKTKPTNLKKN